MAASATSSSIRRAADLHQNESPGRYGGRGFMYPPPTRAAVYTAVRGFTSNASKLSTAAAER